MSSYHHKDLRVDCDDEQDLFASWEPIVNENKEIENELTRPDTRPLVTDDELVSCSKKPDKPNNSDSKQEEKWLDPCKFSGKVVRRSEISNVPVLRYVVPFEKVDAGENVVRTALTRKITVLPPSVGYRGFCNVSDLSDTQRQPWKRIKSENKTQGKDNLVKEYIASDGKKVKMMRLPDEDPPKKIKKLQMENIGTSNHKDDINEFEMLKRIELPPRRKVKSFQYSPRCAEDSLKEVSERVSNVSPKKKSESCEKDNLSYVPGRLMKRPSRGADKKPIKKESLQKTEPGKSVDTLKTEKKFSIGLSNRCTKQDDFKKKDTLVSTSDQVNSVLEDQSAGNGADEEAEDILKDLKSVKAKLAKLSEEIGEGDKETNITIENDKDAEDVTKSDEQYQHASDHQNSHQTSSKKHGVLVAAVQKIVQVDKSKADESNVSENIDCTKKRNCDRNEEERKAAKEYMRTKKAQWKEQQAREQDKKRKAVEARQFKLQQLQQTQLKLLKQSVKKKSPAVEKPNWKGPIHESSSPPPVPAKATTSLAEQVMMAHKKSPKKSHSGSSNQGSEANQIVDERQSVSKSNILPEVENNFLDIVESAKIGGGLHQRSRLKSHLVAQNETSKATHPNFEQQKTKHENLIRKETYDIDALEQLMSKEIDPVILGIKDDYECEKSSPVNLSVIREQSYDDDDDEKVVNVPCVDSKLSILDESKDANKFVEAMNTEMKRLLTEFKLIREKSFQNERERSELHHEIVKNLVENDSDHEQPMNVDILPPYTIRTVGSAGRFSGRNQGESEQIGSSDDHPHSTTQDESLSGGPLHELTDFEMLSDKPNIKLTTKMSSLPPGQLKAEELQTTKNVSQNSKLCYFSSNKENMLTEEKEQKNTMPNLKFLNEKSNDPKWLKTFMSQPNPFNFITVVESKMKLAAQKDNTERIKLLNEHSRINEYPVPKNHKISGDKVETNVLKLNLRKDDNSEPKWLKVFESQPNPFNFMTAVKSKMKMAAEEEIDKHLIELDLPCATRKYPSVPQQQQQQQPEVFLRRQTLELEDFEGPRKTACTNLSEDTDAPSIVSMVEENFESEKVQPLVIEDLRLNLPLSLNSDASSSRGISSSSHDQFAQEVYYQGGGSFIKSKSDSLLNAKTNNEKSVVQPLYIPESIQSLTLLPTSNVCLSDDKVFVTRPNKFNSKVASDDLISCNNTFSVPDTDFDLKSSGTFSGSVIQTASGSGSNIKLHEQTSRNFDHHPIEFEEPRRYDSGRRKKIKLSDWQEHRFENNEQFQIGNVFSPDALFLQFKAELSKLEVFEASLAQVAATEHLRNLAMNSNFNPCVVPQEVVIHGEKSRIISKSPVSGNKNEIEILYEHHNKPTLVVTDNIEGKVTEVNDVLDGNVGPTDHGGATDEEVQIMKISSSEQINRSSNSIRTSQSSTSFQSAAESVSLQVPSVSNAGNNSVEPSNEDLTGTINLNAMSTSATPTSVDRSSSYSNMRLSFTNQRSAAKYSLFIFDQLIKEQKLRLEQQQTAFKLREKALRDRTKAEFTLLEIQRISLREKGLEEQAKNIKKKQRGLLLKWRQDHDDLMKQRSNEELASQERIMMLMQQQNLVKMQMSTKNSLRKMKSALATFAINESSRKKSAAGLQSSALRCASVSSLPDSSGNESRPVAIQKQPHKSMSRTTGDGGNEERDSSATDTGLIKRKPIKMYKGSVNGSDKNKSSSDDSHNSIKWHELQQQKSRPRIVLDRSTSPLQLNPIESNLEKQIVTKAVASLTDGSGEPVVTMCDNTSKVISSIHSGSSDQEITDIPEEIARSQSGSRMVSVSRSGSVSQIQEEITEEELNDHTRLNLQVLPSHYNSDNLESPLSPTTGSSYRTKNESTSIPSSPHQARYCGLLNERCRVSIKGPLTPQLPVGSCRTRKRCSSGSDDSIILSQNETFSEQSDLEVRLSALHEQLRQRKLEAEKLRREQKRAQRERLKAKEQSLIKQIQAYDAYIEQVRKDLEQDLDTSAVPIMKPLIKQTRVTLRKPESVTNKAQKQEKKSMISDESVSEASSIETTIQSSGQIQSIKEADISTLKTEISMKEVSSGDTNEKSVVTEEIESPSEKWIDAARFFSGKTSVVDECLEKNDSVPGSLPLHLALNSENESTEVKVNFSDKIESELSQGSVHSEDKTIAEQLTGDFSEQDDLSTASVSESVKSQKNIVQGHVDLDYSQGVAKVDGNHETSLSIQSVASEQQNCDNEDFSNHLDSNNLSQKCLEDDNQDEDSLQLVISGAEESLSVKSLSLKKDNYNSSLIINEVSLIHSKTPNLDDSENNPETSIDEIDDINIPSDKSTSISLDNKFPLHFDSCKNEEQILKSEEDDVEEKLSIHSTVVPSDIGNEISDKVANNLSSVTASDSFSSEIATTSPESAFSTNTKVNEDEDDKYIVAEENVNENEEIVAEETENVTEEETCVIDSKSSPGSIKLEDSFEIQSSTAAEELDISIGIEKSQSVTSDDSLSNHDDDDSSTDSKISDVIKVFMTEKEKIVKVNDHLEDKENLIIVSNIDNCKSSITKEGKSDENEFSKLNEDNDTEFSCKENNENNYYNLKNKRVDRITDRILSDLLKDSLSFSQKLFSNGPDADKFCGKENLDLETPIITALKKEQEREVKNNLENVMDNFLKKSVKEATDSVFEIYNKKTSRSPSAENKNRRNLEQDNKVPPKTNLGSISFDNSPDTSLSPRAQTFIIYQSPTSDNETSLNDSEDDKENSDKKLDGKSLWLEEEMGLGRTCKEAEELRLQQLQIEEEIQQLERASAGQIGYDDHIPSYYYLREIPNKPPPPYTPPGQACIPTNQQDVLNIVNTAIDYLYSAHSEGDDLSKLQPPNKLMVLDDSPRSVYKTFLFDLIRQLILEAIDSGQDGNLLPWEKTEYKRRCWIPKKTDEIIKRVVIDKVKVLFGFETRTIKENLIIRWSRKKRDKVDELLVRESQEEEQEWTDFSQDETAMKNKITLAILDSLLLETGTILQAAYNNKINRNRCLLNM